MKRAVWTFGIGLMVGIYVTFAYGATVAGTLFALGARFASAGTAPEYAVQVGSAYLAPAEPTPTRTARR